MSKGLAQLALREVFARRGSLGAALASAALACVAACSSSSSRGDPPLVLLPDRLDAAAPSEPVVVASEGPSCANRERDGSETDVDCGGDTCSACATGRTCLAARDCVTRECTEGTCRSDVGCADGTREAFAPGAAFPNIAACAGAWSLPGLVTTTVPACDRGAGNGSANGSATEKGNGCNVADLCQLGWHVCTTAAEVREKTGGRGCAFGAGEGGLALNGFFAVRQSGAGEGRCGAGTDDLFGCGNVGATPDPLTCAPLDRFSNDLCAALPPTWSCGIDSANEMNNVIKTSGEGGGVLCCRD